MNRYKNIGTIRSTAEKQTLRNAIFPEIIPSFSDIYIITTAGDRYDTLALEYYSDSSLWWIIASSNNSKKDSLNVEPGVQLRIPTETTAIIEAYEVLNLNR